VPFPNKKEIHARSHREGPVVALAANLQNQTKRTRKAQYKEETKP
jgi:ribosomal protein S21